MPVIVAVVINFNYDLAFEWPTQHHHAAARTPTGERELTILALPALLRMLTGPVCPMAKRTIGLASGYVASFNTSMSALRPG